MELRNKVAVVTGASGGIGEATARELHAAGMKIVLTARSADKLTALAADLGPAVAVPGEITDPAMPHKLVEAALHFFGSLDVVFNNAGQMTVGKIEEIDIEQVCQMVRLNVEAVYRMTYTALRQMKKAGGNGYIVNTSSIAALKITPTVGAYCGTKAAIESFTDALRLELTDTNIGMACIEPGTVETGLYKSWGEGQKDMVMSGGALQSADIARCVRFILEQPDHMRVPRLLAVPKGQTA